MKNIKLLIEENNELEFREYWYNNEKKIIRKLEKEDKYN